MPLLYEPTTGTFLGLSPNGSAAAESLIPRVCWVPPFVPAELVELELELLVPRAFAFSESPAPASPRFVPDVCGPLVELFVL